MSGRYLNLQDEGFVDLIYSELEEFVKNRSQDRALLFPAVDPYHRYLIHSTVQDHFPALTSVSVGEGDQRRTAVSFRSRPSPPESPLLSHARKQEEEESHVGVRDEKQTHTPRNEGKVSHSNRSKEAQSQASRNEEKVSQNSTKEYFKPVPSHKQEGKESHTHRSEEKQSQASRNEEKVSQNSTKEYFKPVPSHPQNTEGTKSHIHSEKLTHTHRNEEQSQDYSREYSKPVPSHRDSTLLSHQHKHDQKTTHTPKNEVKVSQGNRKDNQSQRSTGFKPAPSHAQKQDNRTSHKCRKEDKLSQDQAFTSTRQGVKPSPSQLHRQEKITQNQTRLESKPLVSQEALVHTQTYARREGKVSQLNSGSQKPEGESKPVFPSHSKGSTATQSRTYASEKEGPVSHINLQSQREGESKRVFPSHSKGTVSHSKTYASGKEGLASQDNPQTQKSKEDLKLSSTAAQNRSERAPLDSRTGPGCDARVVDCMQRKQQGQNSVTRHQHHGSSNSSVRVPENCRNPELQDQARGRTQNEGVQRATQRFRSHSSGSQSRQRCASPSSSRTAESQSKRRRNRRRRNRLADGEDVYVNDKEQNTENGRLAEQKNRDLNAGFHPEPRHGYCGLNRTRQNGENGRQNSRVTARNGDFSNSFNSNLTPQDECVRGEGRGNKHKSQEGRRVNTRQHQQAATSTSYSKECEQRLCNIGGGSVTTSPTRQEDTHHQHMPATMPPEMLNNRRRAGKAAAQIYRPPPARGTHDEASPSHHPHTPPQEPLGGYHTYPVMRHRTDSECSTATNASDMYGNRTRGRRPDQVLYVPRGRRHIPNSNNGSARATPTPLQDLEPLARPPSPTYSICSVASEYSGRNRYSRRGSQASLFDSEVEYGGGHVRGKPPQAKGESGNSNGGHRKGGAGTGRFSSETYQLIERCLNQDSVDPRKERLGDCKGGQKSPPQTSQHSIHSKENIQAPQETGRRAKKRRNRRRHSRSREPSTEHNGGRMNDQGHRTPDRRAGSCERVFYNSSYDQQNRGYDNYDRYSSRNSSRNPSLERSHTPNWRVAGGSNHTSPRTNAHYYHPQHQNRSSSGKPPSGRLGSMPNVALDFTDTYNSGCPTEHCHTLPVHLPSTHRDELSTHTHTNTTQHHPHHSQRFSLDNSYYDTRPTTFGNSAYHDVTSPNDVTSPHDVTSPLHTSDVESYSITPSRESLNSITSPLVSCEGSPCSSPSQHIEEEQETEQHSEFHEAHSGDTLDYRERDEAKLDYTERDAEQVILSHGECELTDETKLERRSEQMKLEHGDQLKLDLGDSETNTDDMKLSRREYEQYTDEMKLEDREQMKQDYGLGEGNKEKLDYSNSEHETDAMKLDAGEPKLESLEEEQAKELQTDDRDEKKSKKFAFNWADEVEDSWDSLYDDSGECLDPDLKQQLNDTLGKVKLEKPVNDYARFQTRSEAEMNEDDYAHVIEIYDFPTSFKTQDLMMVFGPYLSNGFDVKWVDDTHALGIFSTSLMAAEALQLKHPLLKTRSLAKATKSSRAKAMRITDALLPYKPRPATSAALARRLVSGALGLKVNISREVREAERQKLKDAKARKRLEAKQKMDAWEGTLT